MIMESTRLLYEPLGTAHIDDYARIRSNPDVTKYFETRHLWTSPEKCFTQASLYIEACTAHWVRYGFGLWALMTKGNSRLVGHCGFRWTDSGVELMYMLDPVCWHQGFAKEACEQALFAAKQIPLREVIAFVAPDNVASLGLIAKLQFDYTGSVDVEGNIQSLFKRVV